MLDPITLLVYLAILVIVCVVIWYLLTKLALPEPAGTIVQIAIVVIVAVVVILMLYSLIGHAPHLLR